MLVVTLIAVLSAFAIPSFITWRNESRFKSSVDSIAEITQTARTLALSFQQAAYLIVKVNGTQCIAISENTSCNCTDAKSCSLKGKYHTVTFPEHNTTLGNTQGKDIVVTFNALGTVNFGSSTTLTLNRYGYSGKVTVSSLGRVKVCANEAVSGIAQC